MSPQCLPMNSFGSRRLAEPVRGPSSCQITNPVVSSMRRLGPISQERPSTPLTACDCQMRDVWAKPSSISASYDPWRWFHGLPEVERLGTPLFEPSEGSGDYALSSPDKSKRCRADRAHDLPRWRPTRTDTLQVIDTGTGRSYRFKFKSSMTYASKWRLPSCTCQSVQRAKSKSKVAVGRIVLKPPKAWFGMTVFSLEKPRSLSGSNCGPKCG